MELKLAVVGALVAVVAQVFAETQPARLETFDAPTGKSVTWRRLNELDTGLRQIGGEGSKLIDTAALIH